MAMPDIRSRHEFGWPTHPNVPKANTNKGMVAHYDGSDQGLAKKAHTACIAYWQRTRVMHISSRQWTDIGYAFGVCPHGNIFEGRGFGYQQAAQVQQGGGLPDGNSRWVSCTFMSGPKEVPTDAQLCAWHRLRAWLMDAHGVGTAVHGHLNFSETDCPGGTLYRLVTDGTLGHIPKDLGDDDMAMPLLRRGSTGYDVKTLRAELFARGFIPVTVVSDSALRGWLNIMEFDEDLEKIVIGFQASKGLDADGVVGPLTWTKLRRQ